MIPRMPGFSHLLAAEAVSNFGSMLSRLALPWLATIQLGATALDMAGLLAADVLAGAIGGVLLAGWIDRRGKRAVMLLADGIRALLFVLLAAAVWRGSASMALLLAVALVNGAASMVFELARSAWIAEQVAADDRPRRNAQLSAAGSASETAAFALGGWLFQGLGAALAFVVDALSFACSALCLRGVAETARRSGDAAGRATTPRVLKSLADARAGLSLAWSHPGLRVLAGAEALLAAGGGLFATGFMIFVVREVGFAPGPLGLVFAVGGLGAVIGAWAAPAAGRRFGAPRAMVFGLALLALGNACVPLVMSAGALGLVLLLLHQLIGDGGQVLHEVHDRSLRQSLVDPALLARADAGMRFVAQGAMLAAALLGGLWAEHAGVRVLLVLAVGSYALAALWVWAAMPTAFAAPTTAPPARGDG